MACEDQITPAALGNATLDAVTVAEVATSRTGGVSGGALIESTATRFGENVSTLRGQLIKLGYLVPVAYAGSIAFTVDDGAKTVERSGLIYAPLIADLPFTTSGTWTADDEDKFRSAYSIVNAVDVPYENTGSTLAATNTKAAIDELDAKSARSVGLGGNNIYKGVYFDLNDADFGTFISTNGVNTFAAANNWPDIGGTNEVWWNVETTGFTEDTTTRISQTAIQVLTTGASSLPAKYFRVKQEATWSEWVRLDSKSLSAITTNTALSDASATLTAAQLVGGEFTITPTVARIQTTDTAANIIAAMPYALSDSGFNITMINLAALDVTIAAGTGVTLVGNMGVNNGSATFRVRRLTSSTASVTRLETGVSASAESVTGSATFTNSTNNIALTGFGAIAGLEAGDVYSVTGTTNNNKEFTVEVITNDNNVIVNQAHAGGTTTKSLVGETSSCTIKLLTKWYNASAVIGKGRVDLTSSRTLGVTQTNSSGFPFAVEVLANDPTGSSQFELLINGVYVGAIGPVGQYFSLFTIVMPGDTYLPRTDDGFSLNAYTFFEIR